MPKPKVVESRPHDELPVNNAKYVKGCLELYLADRGLTKIANFETFTNLEVLWLNGNRLTRITGLDHNIRLKRLYAFNCRLHTLRGSLPRFRFLEALHVSGNELQNLQTALQTLRKLRHLKHLDMYGNPLAEESNYRLFVIAAVPSLEVLDRHIVTPEERAEAARLVASGGGAAAAADAPADTLDLYFDALDKDGNNRISWAEFLEGATKGLGEELPPLQWAAIEPAEAQRRAQALFAKAATLQRRALTLEEGDERRATMLADAHRIGQRANRVQKTFEELTARIRAPPPPSLKPRSDVLNLFSYGEQEDASSSSDEDEDDSAGQLKAAFGLRGSKMETFRQRRRARRPHTISRSLMNI